MVLGYKVSSKLKVTALISEKVGREDGARGKCEIPVRR